MVPFVELSDGNRMPHLGLGTAGVSSIAWDPNSVVDKNGDLPLLSVEEVRADAGYTAVRHALNCGYRLLDTAALYLNEQLVGQAIKDAIELDKCVTRSDVFVCTKVWNTSHERASVVSACRKSLERLQLDYIDLYLIHWPTAYVEHLHPINPRHEQTGKILYSSTHFTQTWLGMQDVRQMGLVKSIGVSNFNHKMIDQILTMPNFTMPPTVNQVEVHPYLSQEKLFDYCKSKGIILNAYCPLGAPNSHWTPANECELLEHPVIVEMGKKYNKSAAQIVLRYHIQRGIVPIPKSCKLERIEENLNIFNFELKHEDLAKLMALNKNLRLCLNTAGEYIDDHPLYPFNEEY